MGAVSSYWQKEKQHGITVNCKSQYSQKAAGFANYLLSEKRGLIVVGNEHLYRVPLDADSEKLKKIKDVIGSLCHQMRERNEGHNVLFIIPSKLAGSHHYFIKKEIVPFQLYRDADEIDVEALSWALKNGSPNSGYPDAFDIHDRLLYTGGIVLRLANFINQHNSFAVAGLLEEATRTIDEFGRLFGLLEKDTGLSIATKLGQENKKLYVAKNFVMDFATGLIKH